MEESSDTSQEEVIDRDSFGRRPARRATLSVRKGAALGGLILLFGQHFRVKEVLHADTSKGLDEIF